VHYVTGMWEITGMREIQSYKSYKSNNFFFKSPIGFVFIHILECSLQNQNVYTKFGGNW